MICKQSLTSVVVLTRRISYGDGDYQACGSFMLYGQEDLQQKQTFTLRSQLSGA